MKRFVLLLKVFCMKYYTYILYSPGRYQYFIGQTHELPEYMANKHNAGERRTTRKGAPWQLVFSQQFETSFESHLLTQKLQMMKSRKYLRYYIDYLRRVAN